MGPLATTTWRDIISIRFTEGGSLAIEVGPLGLILIGAILVCVLAACRWRNVFRIWKPVEAEVELGGIGKVTLRPSYDDIQIAHKAWVELVTRKAALPFEEEHDVVAEVYSSWYALFQEMRVLVKCIPAEKVRASKDTQVLVLLLIEALNKGLRPHLTKWQARFRHWYEEALKKAPGRSPQEVQREFPQFKELVEDLHKVNKQLVQYAAVIKRVAHGDPPGVR